MFLFQVSETFNLSTGLVLIPKLESNHVPVGTPITIIRPDKSEIETKIIATFFGSNHITIEKLFTKDDVPIGSEVWAKKTITYDDLAHYNLIDKKSDEVNYEIIFQHKLVPQFLLILKLSGVAGIVDNLDKSESPVKLRIDKTIGSYAIDLSIQMKNEEIKTYPEALIFSDKDCVNVIFRGVAKEITYSSRWNES